MPDHLPTVFDYIDFRKYLEDYRKARASNDEGFTHCYICHRLGMKNSRSYFNNIILVDCRQRCCRHHGIGYDDHLTGVDRNRFIC
jgi:alpha-D-ribose 1-methylphosphonate 5-triphosphate diphosphatase PhnM